MKNLSSFAAAAVELAKRDAGLVLALHRGLKVVAEKIEERAKAEFGHYQPAVPPFGAWPTLAESTQEQRVRLGFSADEPLLRTGALRDSITHHSEALEAVIGSTSPVMPVHELGSADARIPPRPVLGPAAVSSEHEIREIVTEALVIGLIKGPGIGSSISYLKKG